MTIQKLALPGGKGSVAATLFNDPGRSNAKGDDFASTLRDSINRTAGHGRASGDDVQAAPVKKRSNSADRREDDNQPDSTGPNTAEAARARTESGDAARAGSAEKPDAAADAPPEQTSESGHDTDTQGRPLSLAVMADSTPGRPDQSSDAVSLFARALPYQTSNPEGMHGTAGVFAKLVTDGNAVPGDGKELPPELHLTMTAGINPDGAADMDIAGMPGVVDVDMALLKTGTEQTGQPPPPNPQGLLLSALAPMRDNRSPAAETSATATNLQLYANAEMGSEAWLDDFGTKIQWLQNMRVSSADMTLHPAELGSIEIRIVTEDNNTRVTIVTQTGAARDIIEGTLPRLREMLASQGMALEQGSVSQHTAEDRRQHHSAQQGNDLADSDDTLAEVGARQQTRLLAAGQIDHYV